jgi:hypothetical protein
VVTARDAVVNRTEIPIMPKKLTDTQLVLLVDGLPPGEGVFLPCSFWLADSYMLQNREAEARALFERLLSLRNDVGLLAEEYDPRARRQVGNFPQAFSHLALIGTALNLHEVGSAQRQEPESPPLATSMRSVLGEGVLE